MAQVKEIIEIVQYHEGLAKGVAKMWNLSREGWGGHTNVMTEEQVKKKEANSENIELYLALDGDEVVGYCGLSEYKEESNSLYIPLLNVRPDYHGQKIGKKLVIKALQKTIELGWPRLDLFTWPGNTKAVPLYKKCGFFWEDRDDVTHLMNFIPMVLNTPLLNETFAEMDWYEASERLIEVKPDGIKENGFTFYEYSWNNGDQSTRVQIERTGRGISLIETDEFLLQLKLADHQIIEQERQEFQIKVVNKTGKPLSFRASGTGDERVQYKMDFKEMIFNQALFSQSVTVMPGEEPSIWRTHPGIAIKVWVNGKECELKLGLFPVQPARLEAKFNENLSFLNKRTALELEIKNNLNEEAEFTVTFPENDLVSLEAVNFSVVVSAKGQRTLSVPLVVRKNGFYNPSLLITAKKKDGTKIRFEQEITAAIKGFGEKFGGESKDCWQIFNGLCQVNVRKRDLLITAAKNSRKQQRLALFAPKLGRPYSNEFAKKAPDSVSWQADDTSITLKMALASGEMAGLLVTQYIRLFADGIVQKWSEVENKGQDTHKDTAIITPIYHERMEQTYFPIDGEVVYFSEDRYLEFGDLKPNSVTENWYFSKYGTDPIGVSWPSESKGEPEGWQFLIEDELGSLASGEKKETKPITVSVGAFNRWQDFRAFAMEANSLEKKIPSEEISFELPAVNANKEMRAALKNRRNSYLEGNLQVYENGNSIFSQELTQEDEKTVLDFKVDADSFRPIAVVEAELISRGMHSKMEELMLSPSDAIVTSQLTEEAGYAVHEINNGCIKIKSAPDFYPGLFSINVNGNEWLDTSFPEITAKSWWNPWAGGMKTVPSALTAFSMSKEKTTANYAEKVDSKGNTWYGLALSTRVSEHDQWKGVHFVQYYVTLPGVPVLASFVEVKDDAGKNLRFETWRTDFFSRCKDLADITFNVDESQNINQYRAGVQELPLAFHTGSYIASGDHTNKFYTVPSLYTDFAETYANQHVLQIQMQQSPVPRQNGIKTAPAFFLFDERPLSGGLLQKLGRIQF